MPPSSPTNRKLSNSSPTRKSLVERCSSLKGCEPCKRRKRACNGQKPCTHCIDASQDCVYSVVSDHPRNVFTTSTARRLSSGSACETCRRRKTKCDGGSPCGFCAGSGIECVNNSERRKRSIAATMSLSSNSSLPSTSSLLALNAPTIADTNDDEAIDRIEDRLKRIEKLMTVFSPSSLSHQSRFTNEIKDIKQMTAGFRKLSSPHLQKPASFSARQHRHSIQDFSSTPSSSSSITSLATDRMEAVARDKSTIASPTDSSGGLNNFPANQQHSKQVPSPSPPLSPHSSRSQSYNQQSTNIVASSLLNLSLSPSSSTSSSSTTYQLNSIQSSVSTPVSPLASLPSSNPATNDNISSLQLPNEWKQGTPIPSLMDQLSKCTFVTAAMDYTVMHYPIYPISNDSTKTSIEKL